MSNEAPADALRLVPVEPTEAMLQGGCSKHKPGEPMSDRWPEECPSFVSRRKIWASMLAAAPASPLPGGGDWINGLPDVPVGSPAWCAWATHEIMNLRAKLPAAPIGEPK